MNMAVYSKSNRQQHALLASGLFIAVWSFLIIICWFFPHPLLTPMLRWSLPMTFATAIAFFLSGCGLVFAYFDFFKVTKALGLLVSALASIYLLQNFFSFEIFSEDLLPSPLSSGEGQHFNRMAGNAALCFLLTGASLWCICRLALCKNNPLVLGVLGALITAVALVTLFGLLGEMESVYLWGSRLGMSAFTAGGFLIIGVTLLYYDWSFLLESEEEASSSWVSLPVGVGIITVALIFSGALWIEQKSAFSEAENSEARRFISGVQHHLMVSRDSLQHMAKIWAFSRGTSRPLWEEEAKFLIFSQTGLQEILWVNANDRAAWIFGEDSRFKTSSVINEKSMAFAKVNREGIVNGVYDESGELVAMALYLPLYTKETFDGYIVGVFDIKKFLQSSLQDARGEKFSISILHKGEEIIQTDPSQPTLDRGIRAPLDLMGLGLEVSVTADEDALSRQGAFLPKLLIFGAMLTILLISLLAHYVLMARRRVEEWKKALKLLRRANNTIAEQDKLVSLGTLTAGIAHEVKNPLNIMKSFSELSIGLVEDITQVLEPYKQSFKVEDRDTLGESFGTLQANLARICEHCKRANNTIQRMLAHSRGNKEAVLTDVPGLLDEYLNLSYHGMRAQDPTFNVKFTKRYDLTAPKIPIVAEDMSRVFLNLFNNAYYALTHKKKREGSHFTPELCVTTQYTKDVFEIRIRDNGCGIPEELKSKVFTPFFTTKPVGMGTGLGLSISHTIVAENGGNLDFVSKEGEFTEFHITLPLRVPEAIFSEYELIKKS